MSDIVKVFVIQNLKRKVLSMKKFLSDFKEFALKGNVVDMAVGVIIGGAFGKIVTSLVNDIITPLISLITGKVMLNDLKWVISPEVKEAGEVIVPEAALTYGNFIQTVIDFLIIALSIFVVLRIIMKANEKLEALRKKEVEEVVEEEQEAEETELSLLKEIRDSLKKEEK